MRIPMRAFWLLSLNINRLRAEEDGRQLMTACAAQSGEGSENHRQRLIAETGEVTVMDPIKSAVRDLDGLNELKRMQ
jgi:hypothetical protein